MSTDPLAPHPEDDPATDPYNPENWDWCGDCDGVISAPDGVDLDNEELCRCTYTCRCGGQDGVHVSRCCGDQIVATPVAGGWDWSVYRNSALTAVRDEAFSNVIGAGYPLAPTVSAAVADARRFIEEEL